MAYINKQFNMISSTILILHEHFPYVPLGHLWFSSLLSKHHSGRIFLHEHFPYVPQGHLCFCSILSKHHSGPIFHTSTSITEPSFKPSPQSSIETSTLEARILIHIEDRFRIHLKPESESTLKSESESILKSEPESAAEHPTITSSLGIICRVLVQNFIWSSLPKLWQGSSTSGKCYGTKNINYAC